MAINGVQSRCAFICLLIWMINDVLTLMCHLICLHIDSSIGLAAVVCLFLILSRGWLLGRAAQRLVCFNCTLSRVYHLPVVCLCNQWAMPIEVETIVHLSRCPLVFMLHLHKVALSPSLDRRSLARQAHSFNWTLPQTEFCSLFWPPTFCGQRVTVSPLSLPLLLQFA